MDAFIAQADRAQQQQQPWGQNLTCGSRQESSYVAGGSSWYNPYDKEANQPKLGNSFYEWHKPTLCLQCSALCHRASNCHATMSNWAKQLINCQWKDDKLVSKFNKTICIMFNICGSCVKHPSAAHSFHSFSLCDNSNHPMCHCSWNWPLCSLVQDHHTIQAQWMEAGSFNRWLTHSFPYLVHDMTHGPPIGNPPPLTHTIISNNLRLVDIYPLYMDNFIQEELNASQFDGPYTIEEAHKIFGGHFCTAPLGFV